MKKSMSRPPRLDLDMEVLVEQELARVFLRVDRVALGLAVGVVGGMGLFVATLALVLMGRPVVGPTLGLLGQYFPGYSVTILGSVIGLFYGCLSGFVAGWLFAALRNAIVFIYFVAIYRSLQLRQKLGKRGYGGRSEERQCGHSPTRLARFNATVQGLTCGILLGGPIFLATNWLILKGGEAAGPHLGLLGQFFLGYRVTFVGSLIGSAYGFCDRLHHGIFGGDVVQLVRNRTASETRDVA